MRIPTQSLKRCLVAAMLTATATGVRAASVVTVDPGASWLGFMNVSELPANGGAYVFGSPWTVTDLPATFSGDVLTLAPNSIDDPAEFWYVGGGGPGAPGNKIMNANVYVETTGVYVGQELTFTGIVLNNTLTDEYTARAFIKDFAPDYSSFNVEFADLVDGVFSISLETLADPNRHVQFGFELTGPNVWITDVGAKGIVQITGIPEPSALALMALSLGTLLAGKFRSGPH
ncbi:MAG TPA: PEP-CTERM sorting domain-containing protein [Verrucomicrobia bacterium]|nr:PEP-CTERM sorting domain-containing protein [Verrucomicrobiota bacterium]HOP96795.1 PEP-CTERM sorting domain-containing protein [Verrucomicrobiota bacterium]HPU55410.1 PEP-CTERM sorting domain-containing protein [Verrucomicrobiota bacterium]